MDDLEQTVPDLDHRVPGDFLNPEKSTYVGCIFSLSHGIMLYETYKTVGCLAKGGCHQQACIKMKYIKCLGQK